MRRRRLLGLLWGLMVLLILAGWLTLYVGETVAALPLGLCPVMVVAGGASSAVGLVACILAAVLVYGGLLWSIWAVSRRKRAGTVGVVVLLTVDVAANVIFTVASWWQLIAVALDAALLWLCWRLYRVGGIPEGERKNEKKPLRF